MHVPNEATNRHRAKYTDTDLHVLRPKTSEISHSVRIAVFQYHL